MSAYWVFIPMLPTWPWRGYPLRYLIRCNVSLYLRLRLFSFQPGLHQTCREVVLLFFFLAANAQRGPWHGHESFFIDVFAAADTFAVLTAVQCLQGLLDESQAHEIAFVQAVQ